MTPTADGRDTTFALYKMQIQIERKEWKNTILAKGSHRW